MNLDIEAISKGSGGETGRSGGDIFTPQKLRREWRSEEGGFESSSFSSEFLWSKGLSSAASKEANLVNLVATDRLRQ